MDIHIVPAEAQDKQTIIDLVLTCHGSTYGDPERPEMPPIEHYIVAKDGEKIIGCAGFVGHDQAPLAKDETEVETCALSVLPEYRNQGLGYKLQLTRMQILHRMGVKIMWTEVDEDAYIDWYVRKFGYERLHDREKKEGHMGRNENPYTLLKLDLTDWFAKHPELLEVDYMSVKQ